MKAIKIEWKGQPLIITESETFELGEEIEEVITLNELAEMADKPKFRKLAKCYSIMINFAGGASTPAEIYSLMMDQIKGDSEATELLIAEAVSTLIEILMDGAPADDGDDEKKPEPSSLKVAS